MFHTFDICQSVAEKIQDLNHNDASFFLKNGNETSLKYGWTNLALFYSVLDVHFPNQKYDELAHQYLVQSLSKVHSEHSISLHGGISGLCFTTYMCSRNELRYKTLLTQLDQLMSEKVKMWLQKSDRIMNDYNLFTGISGALAYLLLRQNDPSLLFYAKQSLSALVNFIQNKKNISDHVVPGWHEEFSDQILGRFVLNSFHGVSGILSTLALASIYRVTVDGLQETIAQLAEWLKNKQKNTAEGPVWPVVVSFEQEIGEKEDELNDYPNNWYYGSSAIARSLFLAYQAIGNYELQTWAEKTFFQTLSLSQKSFSPSFGFGKAGLLAMTYRMYQDTKNRSFLQKVNEMEFEIKKAFNPNSQFGFQTREFPAGGYLTDDSSILNGSIGTALTLLMVAEQHDLNWDRLFLLR